MSKTHAPWTPEQVAKLNEWQACGWVHEFTCNRCIHSVLRATPKGWECPACDYQQDWAHDFMLNGAPPDPRIAIGLPPHSASQPPVKGGG